MQPFAACNADSGVETAWDAGKQIMQEHCMCVTASRYFQPVVGEADVLH